MHDIYCPLLVNRKPGIVISSFLTILLKQMRLAGFSKHYISGGIGTKSSDQSHCLLENGRKLEKAISS